MTQQVEAVVFDWAGTITDYGSSAPMDAFVKLFEKFNVKLTVDQARGPMGAAKLDHIKALLNLPEVKEQWQQVHGHLPTEDDALHLYEVFTPMNAEVVGDYSDLVPGALEVIEQLRQKNIKIGSTTGYNRPIMDRLIPIAKEKGYVPDNIVCAGDLPEGRPSPLMMYQTFATLGIWHPYTVVKVDDTVVGLEEGFNAGTWVVAVALSGNEVGLSVEEWKALDANEQARFREKAYAKFKEAGAHYVIDTVVDLMPVIEDINKRLAAGEKP